MAQVVKKDWGQRGLTVERLEHELDGFARARGGRSCRLQLYVPDNPDLFAGEPRAAGHSLLCRLVGRAAAGEQGSEGDNNGGVVMEVLHMGGCGMGIEGAHALAEALRGRGGTLSKLWLKRNPLTLPGAEAVLRAAAAADCSPRLTSLDFFNAQLGPEAAPVFAEVLRANKKIRHLFLGGNHFGPAGGRAMAQLLRSGSALTRLSLDISHLRDEGAASVAAALQQNTSLTYLCLKYNGFTPRGVASLFDALQANTRSRLETLILGWRLTYGELASKDGVPAEEIRSLANHVGSRDGFPNAQPPQADDEAEAEAEAEGEEQVGKKSEGVEALVRLLREPHCSLTHLNLCRTFLSLDELAAIADAVQHSNNSRLRQLHLHPQTDDPDTHKEEKRIADRVRQMLDSSGREHRQRAQEDHEPLEADGYAEQQQQRRCVGVEATPQPAAPAVAQPAVGMSELRMRKKEITEELQRIEKEDGAAGDDEQRAKRTRELREELAAIADAMQRAKALLESARKVLRKQKKRQRKDDAKRNVVDDGAPPHPMS